MSPPAPNSSMSSFAIYASVNYAIVGSDNGVVTRSATAHYLNDRWFIVNYVMTWKRFQCYWPFGRGILQSQSDSNATFHVFCDDGLNIRLNKRFSCRCYESPWSACDVNIMVLFRNEMINKHVLSGFLLLSFYCKFHGFIGYICPFSSGLLSLE